MSRISSLIDSVRIVLSDTDKQRYPDATLIKYLNDGIKDFVINTKILRERIYLELNTTAAIYDLSPYVLEFLRFQFKSKKITVLSHEELDKIDKFWQDAEGEEVKHITLSNMKKGFLRIYPRITSGSSAIDQNSLFGGLIDITINDDNYQIPSITDVEASVGNYLVIFAVKKPKLVSLTTLDSELELGDEHDLALEYFITSRALRSDTDAQNRSYGNEQLQLYNNYVSEARVSSSHGDQRASDRLVEYRGGIR